MTFEEYMRENATIELRAVDRLDLIDMWNAAQQAEREKYQELIAAAEAAVESYRYLDAQETEEFYKLKLLLDRVKYREF